MSESDPAVTSAEFPAFSSAVEKLIVGASIPVVIIREADATPHIPELSIGTQRIERRPQQNRRTEEKTINRKSVGTSVTATLGAIGAVTFLTAVFALAFGRRTAFRCAARSSVWMHRRSR